MYIFLHFVVLIICIMCLLFALLFVCLHVDRDVTNAHLFMCLNDDIFTTLLFINFVRLSIYLFLHRCIFVYLYTLLLQVCICVFVLHSLLVCNELSSET